MDLWLVNGASRRSKDGELFGRSSTRGARIRGVLGSGASWQQRGLSAQGLNRVGGGQGSRARSSTPPRVSATHFGMPVDPDVYSPQATSNEFASA
jgi:hypothetical protein